MVVSSFTYESTFCAPLTRALLLGGTWLKNEQPERLCPTVARDLCYAAVIFFCDKYVRAHLLK